MAGKCGVLDYYPSAAVRADFHDVALSGNLVMVFRNEQCAVL